MNEGQNVTLVRRFIEEMINGHRLELAEAWGDFDALGMQRQLGLLPNG